MRLFDLPTFHMKQGDTLRDRGVWQYTRKYDLGNTTAAISCPECGQVGILPWDEIKFTGTVEAAIQCEGCQWTAYLVLLDWDPFFRL